MANGAVMEGIETKLFFTFFGLDAITRKQMNKLHTGVVGNPAMRMPGGIPFPTLLGMIPGVEAGVSAMMKSQMDALGCASGRRISGYDYGWWRRSVCLSTCSRYV